jgi:hypothetical protein
MKKIILLAALAITGAILAPSPASASLDCTNKLAACPGCTNKLVLDFVACPGCTNKFTLSLCPKDCTNHLANIKG